MLQCHNTHTRQMTAEVRELSLDNIIKRQREMMNPSNGRIISGPGAFLDSAMSKRATRLQQYLKQHKTFKNIATNDALFTHFTADDIFMPPALSLDEFWAMFDREFSGLEFLKSILQQTQLTIEYTRANKQTLFGQRYNFLFQGPPGTGKTTIAKKIIGPFFCALDVIPSAALVQKVGGDLQAKYVGQTNKVSLLCDLKCIF